MTNQETRAFYRTLDPKWCNACHHKNTPADHMCIKECFEESPRVIQYLVKSNDESWDEARAEEMRSEL